MSSGGAKSPTLAPEAAASLRPALMTEPPTHTSAQGTSSTPTSGPRAQRPVRTPPARPRRRTTDARLERAHELLASDSFDVLSLDVFDTILWRKVPEPA